MAILTNEMELTDASIILLDILLQYAPIIF